MKNNPKGGAEYRPCHAVRRRQKARGEGAGR